MSGMAIMVRIFIQVLVVFCLVSAAHAQPAKRLWVLQEPDAIVEYDTASMTAGQTIKVPKVVLKAPERLIINGKGQMLFYPVPGAHTASGRTVSSGQRVWFWDGGSEREWPLESTRKRISGGIRRAVLETVPQCFLSDDGQFLIWFENRFEKILDKIGFERSVRPAWRIWRTDLAGGRPETIASISSAGWCRCTTGVCSESCPEWTFWAPDGVVGDFFLLTQFTPGQIGTTYHASTLYRRSDGKWPAKKLPRPVEKPIDAAAGGKLLIAVEPDSACCGWDNESNDRTLLLKDGKMSVIFDEFKRFRNQDYDISFFTSDARLSPDQAVVAYTVLSTGREGSDIRLSYNGTPDPQAFTWIYEAMRGGPAVEIMRPERMAQPEAVIRHASLVGWLNQREILAVQGGTLIIYNTDTNTQKETGIRVRSAADAFLR